MSYGIIVHHKGNIDVESIPGKGTAFTIMLPISRKKIPKLKKINKKVIKGNGEKILVIDDEEVVRNRCRVVLENLNYIPIICSNGRKGINAYRKYGKEIGIVLLDIIMPGTSGETILMKILELDFNAKVIIISGYREGEKII